MLVAMYDYFVRGDDGLIVGMFDLALLFRWLPLSAGWAVSDVAEVMAGGRIDPSTYTVLVQSRIVGTAIMMRVTSGIPRSKLQWSILFVLMLVIIGWNLTPNQFGVQGKESPPSEAVGLVLTVLRVVLSVLCGVFGQRALQESPLPFHVQQAQICTTSLLWSCLMIPPLLHYVYPYVLRKPWSYGLFGGPAVPFGEGFNSIRPWVVVGTYIFREYTVNFCVKNFDALVKNFCHAFSAVLVYYINSFALHAIPFNYVKGIFTIIIGMEIVHFGLAHEVPSVGDNTADVEDKLTGDVS